LSVKSSKMSFSKITTRNEASEKYVSNTTIFKKLYPERNLRVNPIDPYRLKTDTPSEVIFILILYQNSLIRNTLIIACLSIKLLFKFN